MKIHQNDAGHMTWMAAMHIIWYEPFKLFFPETRPISTKFGTQHRRLKLINDNPGWLTFIYFKTWSNLATGAFILDNVTIMDSLKSIASCDLECFFIVN